MGGTVQIKTRLAHGEGAVLGDPGKADPGTARAAGGGVGAAVLSFRRGFLQRRLEACRGPWTGLALLGRAVDVRRLAAGAGGSGGDETRPGDRQGYSGLVVAGRAAADSGIPDCLCDASGEHGGGGL